MILQTTEQKQLANELCVLLRSGTLDEIQAKVAEIRTHGWQFECSLDNYAVLSNNEEFIYMHRDKHYPTAVIVGKFPW